MCMQVFTIGFDLSLVLKIGIKSIFYKVACFVLFLKGGRQNEFEGYDGGVRKKMLQKNVRMLNH